MDRPICPKCGYARQASDTAPSSECPCCGIVFAKYAQHLADRTGGTLATQRIEPDGDENNDWLTILKGHLFAAPNRTDSTAAIAEAIVGLLLIAWGISFIAGDWRTGDAGSSFLHGVNLAFHEFGHLLFRPFGEWMMFLGGSLFQCLVPLLLGGVFVWREGKPFAGAVCLWWLGQNLIDVAPYIGDARDMALPLTGEWNDEMVEMRYLRHDWHNLLEPLGMLNWDHRLAGSAHWLGAATMLLAWIWMGWWLWQCWQLRQATAE